MMANENKKLRIDERQTENMTSKLFVCINFKKKKLFHSKLNHFEMSKFSLLLTTYYWLLYLIFLVVISMWHFLLAELFSINYVWTNTLTQNLFQIGNLTFDRSKDRKGLCRSCVCAMSVNVCLWNANHLCHLIFFSSSHVWFDSFSFRFSLLLLQPL